MAKGEYRDSTKAQEIDVNEIKSGMELIDSKNLLGRSDLTKPRVEKVIHHRTGRIKSPLVRKGLSAGCLRAREEVEHISYLI
jgi:hypothetical protein